MRAPQSLILAFLAVFVTSPGVGHSDETLRAADPIASVDAQPIFFGELSLLLNNQLGIQEPRRADSKVQRAATLMLVRRHLAMRALREQGGDALASIMDKSIESFADELKRRGSSLAEYAEQRGADTRSLKSDLAWRAAWKRYITSRLTNENLKRFYESRRLKYAGARWEVCQIFLEVDASERDALEIARRRMQFFIQQLNAASDVQEKFAELAQNESDAASAADGGYVGWVAKEGDLPLSVMAAVRRTSAGSVSAPVRSAMGMHLVLVQQIEAQQVPFEELEDRAQLRRDATDALFRYLVKSQADAKVAWLVPAFAPPPDVPVIPGDATASNSSGQTAGVSEQDGP